MPPATFFGTVTVDGRSVSDGTEVVALIDSKVCSQEEKEPDRKGTWTATEANPEYSIESGDSLYVVDVVSDSQVPGCGTNGAIVTFLISERPAHQRGLWKAGSNPLNLTSEPETSDGSGFNWWPAVAGGSGLAAAAVIAAALWQARRMARRKRA